MTFNDFLSRLDYVDGAWISHVENLAPITLAYDVGNAYKPYIFLRDRLIGNKILSFYIKDMRNNNTTSNILRDLANCCHLTELYRINKDGRVYYGNRFIMFDSDFNLLYTYLLKGDMTYYANRDDDIIFYVSPSVFENNKNYLEKLIITKMIPFYASNDVYIHGLSTIKKMSILIGDNNGIVNVRKTVTPTDFNNINKEIKELLIKNYDKYSFH